VVCSRILCGALRYVFGEKRIPFDVYALFFSFETYGFLYIELDLMIEWVLVATCIMSLENNGNFLGRDCNSCVYSVCWFWHVRVRFFDPSVGVGFLEMSFELISPGNNVLIRLRVALTLLC